MASTPSARRGLSLLTCFQVLKIAFFFLVDSFGLSEATLGTPSGTEPVAAAGRSWDHQARGGDSRSSSGGSAGPGRSGRLIAPTTAALDLRVPTHPKLGDALDVDQAGEPGDPSPTRRIRPRSPPSRPEVQARGGAVPPDGPRAHGRAGVAAEVQPLSPRGFPGGTFAVCGLPPWQQRQPMRCDERRASSVAYGHRRVRAGLRGQWTERGRARLAGSARENGRRRRHRALANERSRRARGQDRSVGHEHGCGDRPARCERGSIHRRDRAGFPVRVAAGPHDGTGREMDRGQRLRRAARGDKDGRRLDALQRKNQSLIRHRRAGNRARRKGDVLPRVLRTRQRGRFHRQGALGAPARRVRRRLEAAPRVRRGPQLASAGELLRRRRAFLPADHAGDARGDERAQERRGGGGARAWGRSRASREGSAGNRRCRRPRRRRPPGFAERGARRGAIPFVSRTSRSVRA